MAIKIHRNRYEDPELEPMRPIGNVIVWSVLIGLCLAFWYFAFVGVRHTLFNKKVSYATAQGRVCHAESGSERRLPLDLRPRG